MNIGSCIKSPVYFSLLAVHFTDQMWIVSSALSNWSVNLKKKKSRCCLLFWNFSCKFIQQKNLRIVQSKEPSLEKPARNLLRNSCERTRKQPSVTINRKNKIKISQTSFEDALSVPYGLLICYLWIRLILTSTIAF
jgi:hypothetical protein